MPIDTPTLPYLVVLGVEKIDLLLRDDLDTLLTGDRDIDFNPIRDIEELEWLLAGDPVPVPRVFDEPLGHSDSISRSFDVTFSNPLFNFNDDYTLCYDNPLFDEEFEDIRFPMIFERPFELSFRILQSASPIYPKDGRVYTNIPAYVPPVALVQTPPSPKWSSGSLPISPSSPVGAQLELHGSILHDHTQRLDALPPTLFVDIDKDVRELYTRSGAVRDEIFLPVLALEAWKGHTHDQRAALWHAIYDIQRENHDLRMQLAEERREQLQLADHVTRMERRQESKKE
ncbi:hypothetical protein Tco_0563980 [Tanacetum coccineum]